MKRAGSIFTVALLLIICLSNKTAGTFTIGEPGKPSQLILSFINKHFITDTIPPPTGKEAANIKSLKKPPVPKLPKTKNFFQLLLSAFQFKKNAKANEEIRVRAIIDSLGINTNLEATEANVKLLDSLTSLNTMSFDTLLIKINKIVADQKNNATEQQNTINDLRRSIAPRTASPGFDLNKELIKLAAKMQTIILYKINEDDLKARMIRVAFIDSVRKTSGIVHRDTLMGLNGRDSVVKQYSWRVKNKATVYGLSDISSNFEFSPVRLSQLDYFMFTGFYIEVNTSMFFPKIEEQSNKGSDPISLVQQSGCKVGFSFKIPPGNPSLTGSFLEDSIKQKKFIRYALALLAYRNGYAINIAFDQVPAAHESNFTDFIRRLYNAMKKQEPRTRLSLMIPAGRHEADFPLQQLNPFVDHFIIDFSKNFDLLSPDPIAPLFGEQPFTIQSTVSRYQAQDIPADKIIINLPYKGSLWVFTKTLPPAFKGYVNYADIRNNYWSYSYFSYYSKDSTIAIMDSTVNLSFNKDSQMKDTLVATLPLTRLYYDDAVTLGKKYQFTLDSKLGGIAVTALGDDKGYADLWDEMTYRFADTFKLSLPDSNFENRWERVQLSTLQKWSRYLGLFKYILNNPCEKCYEDIKDDSLKNKLQRYLFDLKIDSTMHAENTKLLAKGEDTYRSHFEYLNYWLDYIFRIISLVLFILTVVTTAIYIVKTKNQGNEWKGKRVIGWTCVISSNLFLLAYFSFLFASNAIPYFGTTTSNNSGYSKSYAGERLINNGMLIQDTSYCDPDPTQVCFNTPLHVFLLIISLGLIIGILITYFLIMPVMKRKNIL